jgi:hypothetical protein
VDRRIVPLKLEIDIGSDPISGMLELDAQTPYRFSGWIELAGAIESARASNGAAFMPPPADAGADF